MTGTFSTRQPARRILSLGAASAALALVLTGCSAGGGSDAAPDENCTPIAEVETINEGELTVLVAEHPPFVTMQGNELGGIEGELINRIADDLCLELNAQVTSFPAIIEGLQNGRADLSSSNWTVNDERRELFEVSDGIYEGGMGIVTKGEDLTTVEDLEGLTIGTPQGYLWIEQLQALYGAENIKEYQSDTAVLDDVKAGRIDAGAVSILANTWRLTQDQYSDLTINMMEYSEELPYTHEPPLSVVLIEKGNVALKDATNQTLAEFGESGDLASVFEEYGLDPALVLPAAGEDG